MAPPQTAGTLFADAHISVLCTNLTQLRIPILPPQLNTCRFVYYRSIVLQVQHLFIFNAPQFVFTSSSVKYENNLDVIYTSRNVHNRIRYAYAYIRSLKCH